MNHYQLSRPLDISDIDFRVQSINNGGYATILAYKDARVDMARLDDSVGSLNWQRKHEVIGGNLYCHVGIYNSEIKEWVWKTDVGTESMTEATKGQSSDSFKRACFNWGVGRELYSYPVISVKLNENEFDNKSGRPKQTYNLKIRDWRWYSEFTDGKISFLAAKDEKGKLRFKWGEMKPKEVEPEYKQAAPTQVEAAPDSVVETPIKEEGDVKSFLKKEATPLDEIDGSNEERERAITEYKTVFGKAPHGRMSTDNMLNAVQEEIMRLNRLEEQKKEDEEFVAPPPPENSVILSSIKDMYDSIEIFKDPKKFIEWAKDIVTAFIETEPEDNIEEFKTLCNTHYKKLVS